jgi:S-adenosylmethionine:tRNA ribosyltransferase-isomerase
MKTRDFFFDLPPELVAQYPERRRGESRLLVLNRSAQSISHHMFDELPALLRPDTLVAINDSRVRRARVYGKSADSGAEVEFLLLKELSAGVWRVKCAKAKKQRPGKEFIFPARTRGIITGEDGEYRTLKFGRPIDERYLKAHGHVPLPPYIKRGDRALDGKRYQTVYAGTVGSVAAPTAGLHFSRRILRRMMRRGMEFAPVTLHVGPGTFNPVRTERVEDHRMHSEEYEIPAGSAALLNAALQNKRPILAVGTTTVRALESACGAGKIKHGMGSTELFIYPGYGFRVVSALLTNFHTPGSTLLVLVSAFAGRELVLHAYEEAKKLGYRFFSYGDAMLVL